MIKLSNPIKMAGVQGCLLGNIIWIGSIFNLSDFFILKFQVIFNLWSFQAMKSCIIVVVAGIFLVAQPLPLLSNLVHQICNLDNHYCCARGSLTHTPHTMKSEENSDLYIFTNTHYEKPLQQGAIKRLPVSPFTLLLHKKETTRVFIFQDLRKANPNQTWALAQPAHKGWTPNNYH